MIKVTVECDKNLEHEGKLLLYMEKTLRLALPGFDVRVYKELHGDDSKARSLMTIGQRSKL